MENKKKPEGNSAGAPDGAASSEAPEQKTKLRNYLLSGAFLIALIAVTFYVIFKDNSVRDIWGVLRHVNLSYTLAGVLSMFGFIFFQGVVIGLSAQCVQIKMSLWEMMQYSFVGFFYSGITPSAIGGQPMQFYHMCRDRMSISKATLMLFVANLTYQIVIVVMGLIMFFTKLSFIIQVRRSVIVLFFFGLSVNLFILLIILGVLISENLLRNVLNGFVVFLAKIKIIKNPESAHESVGAYLDEFKSGVELLKENKLRFFLILLATSAHFILYHIIPFFVYRALGFRGYTCFDFIAISAVLYVAINYFPLPGSVGAAESGFVVLFAPYFAKLIMPAMLLSRFINFYTMIVISGVFSAFAQLRKPYDLSDEVHILKRNPR